MYGKPTCRPLNPMRTISVNADVAGGLPARPFFDLMALHWNSVLDKTIAGVAVVVDAVQLLQFLDVV